MLVCVPGQLAWLTHGDKSYAESLGNAGAKDEATAFDANNSFDFKVLPRSHLIKGKLERFGADHQRADILKNDARLWKIRNITNELV